MLDFIIGISCVILLGIGLCVLAKQEEKLYEKKLQNDIERTKIIVKEMKKNE